jgi:hypothetical protein
LGVNLMSLLKSEASLKKKVIEEIEKMIVED